MPDDPMKALSEPLESAPTKLRALTAKQEAFAQLVAEGVNQNEAYCEAYNTSASVTSATVRTNASKLANKDYVKARIMHLKALSYEEVTEGEPETPQDLADLDWVLKRLKSEAENPKGSAASRIRALELIGKAQGMFSDDINVNVHEPKSSDEVLDELKQVIAAISGKKAHEISMEDILPTQESVLN